MDMAMLQDFFFWCMIINTGIYTVTAVAAFSMRPFIHRINKKVYGLDQASVDKSMNMYFTLFKLLITIFNFTPWLAILVIR